MKANLKGLLLEKFTRERIKNNQIETFYYFRIYQTGDKNLVDVLVDAKLYNLYEENEEVELNNCVLTIYNNDIYVKYLG